MNYEFYPTGVFVAVLDVGVLEDLIMKRTNWKQRKMLRNDIAQLLCKEDTFENMFLSYCAQRKYVRDLTILKNTSKSSGLSLYEGIMQYNNLSEQLYAPFNSGRIFVVNNKVVRRMKLYGNGFVRVVRRISFDTQTISYLGRYKGNSSSLPQNIGTVVELLRDGRSQINYCPYVMENRLGHENNREKMIDSLCAVEKLYYNGQRSMRYCRKRAERAIAEMDKVGVQESWYSRTHWIIYSILLKICFIHLSKRKKSLKYKMDELCRFMDEELQQMMIPEVILAKRYFEQGHELSFFGKVQLNNTDLLDDIRNMSWDLTHLRVLERECVNNTLSRGEVIVPYMFTYDKRLLQIKDCYMLDAIAIFGRTKEHISTYFHENEVREYLVNYFTADKKVKRADERGNVDIMSIVKKCEKEIKIMAEKE